MPGQHPLTTWIALGLMAETGIFAAAGFAWLRSREYTLAEAGAGALVGLFVAFSLMHQLSFWLGSAWIGYGIESMALVAVCFAGRRWLPMVARSLAAGKGMLRREALPGWIILTAWIAVGGIAVFEALMNVSRPPLPIPGAAAIALEPGGLAAAAAGGPLTVLNPPALFFHTARFGLSPNACGFGLLAYMALGFSVYALARRYAWPPMALTVVLLVLSMPRLVFLAMRPTAEIIAAAATVFSLVLIYRLIEQHQARDLRFFLLCVLFSIHAHIMSIALAGVLALLLVVVMIRRHGWLLWREMITERPLISAAWLLPALALAQAPVILLNSTGGHPFRGPAVGVEPIGILTAAANLIRYLLICIDITEPIRQMVAWTVGVDLEQLMVGVYNALARPLFQQAGVTASFAPVLSGAGQMGFGPFAALLVLPAMVHAAVRGPRRLKALVVAWAGYLYLAALMVKWQPANLAILTPLLAANGFVVAFSLPPWRLRRRGLRLLQIDFALLLVWAIFRVGWGPHG
jgi:hypothetical protein